MKCLAGFSFYQSRIGDIDTDYKDNEKQRADIKSRRRKAMFIYSCKGLYGLSNTVCHIVYKIQLVCLLYHIACGIA